jgi:hypothetical protein
MLTYRLAGFFRDFGSARGPLRPVDFTRRIDTVLKAAWLIFDQVSLHPCDESQPLAAALVNYGVQNG